MRNKEGYTIPMAMALMLLLFALAGSLLLIAAYRYQSTFIQRQQNQLYLYADELVNESAETIEAGELNQGIAQILKNILSVDTAKLSAYAKEYNFKYNMGKDIHGNPKYLDNTFVANENGKIYLEMLVTYEPQNVGKTLPPKSEDYIKIGDNMNIEYRIKQGDMEYRINAKFYCSKDSNKNPDGSTIPAPQMYVNMKWSLVNYTGKLYTK